MPAFIAKIRVLLLAWLHLRSPPSVISRRMSFVRNISYKEIKKATDDFRRIIAKSSNGAAYRAKFQNGNVAIVKELKLSDAHDDAVFYREVHRLERLHHRHIVSLIGFSNGHKRYLVFENLGKGSLKEHLSDPLKTPLNWGARLKIAVSVAAAVEYLHFFCDPPLYHVSISSSTILLDDNFTAKLSAIGLLSSSEDHEKIVQASCSEECYDQISGSINFQLGLLILELITGQSSDQGGTDLVQWIQSAHLTKSIHQMIDPDLGNSFDSRELKGLLAIARMCIRSGNKPRTDTHQVLLYLQKKIGLER